MCHWSPRSHTYTSKQSQTPWCRIRFWLCVICTAVLHRTSAGRQNLYSLKPKQWKPARFKLDEDVNAAVVASKTILSTCRLPLYRRMMKRVQLNQKHVKRKWDACCYSLWTTKPAFVLFGTKLWFQINLVLIYWMESNLYKFRSKINQRVNYVATCYKYFGCSLG